MPELDMVPTQIPSSSPDPGPSTLDASSPLEPSFGAKVPSPELTPTIISPRPSPSSLARSRLPDIDIAGNSSLRTPQRNHSTGSGAWSTIATPGLPEEDDEPARFHQPSAPPLDPASPPRSPTDAGDRKNVRFMGPDGAPLSPAHTYLSVDSVPPPVAPPPTEFSTSPPQPSDMPSAPHARPRGDSGASANTVPRPLAPVNGNGNGRTRGDSSASARSNGFAGMTSTHLNGNGHGDDNNGTRDNSRGSPALQLANPPPPPPPSLASIRPTTPPLASNGGGLGLTAGPPAPISLSRKQVDQAQKHAKWAISALDYDDYDTARSELKKALGILGA